MIHIFFFSNKHNLYSLSIETNVISLFKDFSHLFKHTFMLIYLINLSDIICLSLSLAMTKVCVWVKHNALSNPQHVFVYLHLDAPEIHNLLIYQVDHVRR